MIRLQDLISEITMHNVAPYATQFTWHAKGDSVMTSQLVAAGAHSIEFMMVSQDTQRPVMHWGFAFSLPSRNRRDGRTMDQQNSAAVGQISYLRVMRTAGEAILDFCAQHAPESITIQGTDSDDDKEAQKTRLYWMFLQDNQTRFTEAGYRLSKRSGYFGDDVIWITRISNADTTGTENGND